MPQLPIIIIGAGPAGLSLAQSLISEPLMATSGPVPVRILERSPRKGTRPTGYRIRIAPHGVDALRSLLPPNVLAKFEATTSKLPPGSPMAPGLDDCLDAVTGGRLGDEGLFGKASGAELRAKMNAGSGPGRGEVWPVDRGCMMRALRTGLEDKIEWEREVVKVDDEGENGVAVKLQNGEEIWGCVVVAADGVRSRVRKTLVPSMEILDTGGRWVFGKTLITPEVEQKCGDILKKFSLAKERRDGGVDLCMVIETMRFEQSQENEVPANYVYWVLQTRKEYFDINDEELLKMVGSQAAGLSKKMVAGWAESFRALLDLQNETDTAVLRIASTRPELPIWSSKMITLLGDAAHLMSPAAAVGATTGMIDALTLRNCLRDSGINKESIAAYEERMRKYAPEPIIRSMVSGKWLFGMVDWDQMMPLDDGRTLIST